MLLEGYLHAIPTNKASHLHSSKTTLQGSMLLLYLKAATLWIHTKLGVNIPLVCPHSQRILPPFGDPITPAFKWGSPQDKRKLYTHQMLCTFIIKLTIWYAMIQQNICYALWQFSIGFISVSSLAVVAVSIAKPGHDITLFTSHH